MLIAGAIIGGILLYALIGTIVSALIARFSEGRKDDDSAFFAAVAWPVVLIVLGVYYLYVPIWRYIADDFDK